MHLSSIPVLVGLVLLNRIVFVLSFVSHCLSFFPFTFGHCVVGSSIYGYWLPSLVSSDVSDYLLWYPQTFLITPFGILRLFGLPPLISSDVSDYPLWYPQTFLITPFDILRLFWLPPLISSDFFDYPFGILRLFWLPPLVSSNFSDYPLWYPQTLLITPFGILIFFWLFPLVSSDFSDYPFGILRLFSYSVILWSWHCRMIVYFSILRFICTIIFCTFWHWDDRVQLLFSLLILLRLTLHTYELPFR